MRSPISRRGNLEFRGVQLDLARQPENLDYIKSFIDFASKSKYNYLVLYLEGRIKTKSFPYKSAGESYSTADMEKIVAYAGKKKIEVVPAVSTLGHAEHFLSCPELEHLAELRGGREGRFSKFKHVFCPSLKETNKFLGNYLAEVSTLFPSEYFHAGFDEAWDIGYCDVCLKRLETETPSDIFAQQIIDIHGIVTKKLKKRMIIWDDLFDIYPQALGKISRDIILCSWHYDYLVERPAGHCGGPQADIFSLYDKFGFEYIFAPAAFSNRNVETFTRYAVDKKPLGALLTIWENERSFLFADYPTIAYAGALWSGQGRGTTDAALQDQAVRATTGCGREEQFSLIKAILSTREMTLPAKPQAYVRGAFSQGEYERNYFLDIAKAALASYASNASGQLQRDVLEDMAVRVELESIYFVLRELISSLYLSKNMRQGRQDPQKKLAKVVDRLKAVKAKRHQQWSRHRKGITPCGSDTYLDSLMKMISEAVKDSKKTKALCKVTFPFNANNMCFSLKYQNGEEWHKIVSGSFSQAPFVGPFHYYFPLDTNEAPEAVRIEAWGYVGSGVSFLDVETKNARFVPASIAAIDGHVIHPESLLEDGRDWCFMGEGEQCARKKFLDPSMAKIRNAIEINLTREEL